MSLDSKFNFLRREGLGNSEIGHTLGDIVRPPTTLTGSCREKVKTVVPGPRDKNGKLKVKERYCDFETTNRNQSRCPYHGVELYWSRRIVEERR